ncbi:MAG: ABC transporter permease [Rhodospirillales bacterium]
MSDRMQNSQGRPALDGDAAASPPEPRWLRAWRAFAADRAALISLIFLGLVVLLAIFADWVSPHDPFEAARQMRNQPPLTEGYWLGSDSNGRDILTRLIYGGRISLVVGFLPTLTATLISLFLGLLAGYFGGWIDQIIMRVLDAFFAVPLVLMAIAIAGVLQPGVVTEIVAITVVLVPYISRIVRTSTLGVTSQPYIEAARAGGASQATIILRYVLPNMISPVIVYATTLVGLMIVVASGLSFLGLGAQPPAADWGTMVSDGRVAMTKAPHATIFPGLVIVFVALAFNFLGDGLRDALDPKAGARRQKG